jgi:hypothetical protein
MSNLIVTVDLDWACEPAIEKTLDFLRDLKITPTVFITHRSPRVEAGMCEIEVGLHPFFDTNSSHGSTIDEVVKHIMDLPHNFAGFRCHRFGISNSSKQLMAEAGMLLSSNVCTDLEIIPPFKDRFGLLEVPIFLEDGGYLWRQHQLIIDQKLTQQIIGNGTKVITIHPMHFALNTPHFSYMYDIKQSMSREEWKNMTKNTMQKLCWKGHGIRNFITELLQIAPQTSHLSSLLAPT